MVAVQRTGRRQRHCHSRFGQPRRRPSAFVATGSPAAGAREYKILSAREKYFDGNFDLARLEEALNHFAKQGWAVKAVSTQHFKGYTGAMEETITVLLER
jgi:hypothetical protein